LPKKLELQVSLATLSPEAGVIHTDYYVLRNADLELGSRRGFQRAVPSGWVAEPLFLDNFILTSSVLIRKDVFGRSGGFNQRFSPAKDYHLGIRVSRECQIAYVSEPLTIYRDHEEGISSSQMISRIRAAEVLENIALNIPSIWKE